MFSPLAPSPFAPSLRLLAAMVSISFSIIIPCDARFDLCMVSILLVCVSMVLAFFSVYRVCFPTDAKIDSHTRIHQSRASSTAMRIGKIYGNERLLALLVPFEIGQQTIGRHSSDGRTRLELQRTCETCERTRQ